MRDGFKQDLTAQALHGFDGGLHFPPLSCQKPDGLLCYDAPDAMYEKTGLAVPGWGTIDFSMPPIIAARRRCNWEAVTGRGFIRRW
jgi:hypothetical protein